MMPVGGRSPSASTANNGFSPPDRRQSAATGNKRNNNNNKPLNNIVTTLISSCLCNGNYHFTARKGMGPQTQIVEMRGIRFIGLGAVVDELTPRERVYDTLEVFRTRTERLVSIGYLLDRESEDTPRSLVEKVVETFPLDTWNRDFPDQQNLTKEVKRVIDLVKVSRHLEAAFSGFHFTCPLNQIYLFRQAKQFSTLAGELTKQLQRQKAHLQGNGGINFYVSGITAHNLGVAKVLSGDERAAEPCFREAIALKEAAFGRDHDEVALSWDELGIQLFARGNFDDASAAFREAHRMRHSLGSNSTSVSDDDVPNPILAMTLNNIACCDFQKGDHETALRSLEEARSIQHRAVGSPVQDDLDLLHVAIVYCNCGYLKLAMKQYDEARSILEEALLIQQSVLDDNHRAVRDTLSNIEFTNAFHS